MKLMLFILTLALEIMQDIFFLLELVFFRGVQKGPPRPGAALIKPNQPILGNY